MAHSRLGSYSNVDFQQTDAASRRLETRHFDLVVLHYTLHEIEDRAEVIINLTRALKPGGRLVIREPLRHAPEITPGEIELLCYRQELEQLKSSVRRTPFVGTHYHGIFRKQENQYKEVD